jgi:hypothetical protein
MFMPRCCIAALIIKEHTALDLIAESFEIPIDHIFVSDASILPVSPEKLPTPTSSYVDIHERCKYIASFGLR